MTKLAKMKKCNAETKKRIEKEKEELEIERNKLIKILLSIGITQEKIIKEYGFTKEQIEKKYNYYFSFTKKLAKFYILPTLFFI